MYGILLASISHYIIGSLGKEAWNDIKKKVGINYNEFIHKKVYSETLVNRIINATEELYGIPRKTLMIETGKFFMESLEGQGFSKMLRVLGRNFSDFLNGLDNLHEYVRFSFPRLKAPSFTCEREHESGISIRYRSKRKGYHEYVMGILIKAAKLYYNLDIEIAIHKDSSSKDITDVSYDLKFPNKKFKIDTINNPKVNLFPLSPARFLSLFPFHLVFDKNLIILSAGNALKNLMQDIVGQSLDETFSVIKPLIEIDFNEIIEHSNNVFEIQSLYETNRIYHDDNLSIGTQAESLDEYSSAGSNNLEATTKIIIKGQMIKLDRYLLFIGVPIISNIETLSNIGLFLNDLSMHDSSRELLVAGAQQNAELKLALDREMRRGHELEMSMSKLDLEKKRKEELLYQLIPKEICYKLNNSDPNNICEVCDSVTLLFTDIVGFTSTCSRMSPMEVVGMLNLLYTSFDECIDKYQVYKVETIGDAYLICGGLPVKTDSHASDIVETALLMMKVIKNFNNPFNNVPLQMRAGIHSGSAVAGIVDRKMPRYCLFGEITNITKKLETLSRPMHIHASNKTFEMLGTNHPFIIEKVVSAEIEEKLGFPTYWILGKYADKK
ncbi:unnamed protein product [Gordionus sp. m RMFG-2023]|uniref:soluble guanylate cyclase 88E-like n=1 Tax=Gordionus sp. m RMFG-2023 TaxID=3053472 RepID=UPI0030E5D5BE